jgi:hypothetical protein
MRTPGPTNVFTLLALSALCAACRSAPPPARSSTSTLAKAAPAPAAPTPLESIDVPATGAAVTTRTSLARGELYLLRALGAAAVGELREDAEYGFAPDAAYARDIVDGVDVGLDVGLEEVLPASGRKPAPPTGHRRKWFGAFRLDHAYHMVVTGLGEPLRLTLVRPAGATAATGAVTVALFRLTPPPPALAAPIETIRVPAREKVSVTSRLKGEAGAVYLLEAAGEVQVGGPRHMGDAEFHDYRANGTGFNEGENDVDFGVGVDEPVIGTGHDPRIYKWGAYRPDHVYYLLYAGTGEGIGLNYHDTGGKSGVFKDNEGFLPVRIFAVP